MNLEKLYVEIKSAGLPIYTISPVALGSSVGPVIQAGGAWIEFTRALTGPETTTLNNLIAAHDPVDYVVQRQEGAEAQAQAIPNWATWTEEQFLTWCTNNLMTDAQIDATTLSAALKTNLKSTNAFVRNAGRLLVALRNKAFPKLEGS